MRIAYVQCIGGASGDMLLGAALDAGADREALEQVLRSLPLPPFRLHVAQAQRGHVTGTQVTVELPQPAPSMAGYELLRAVTEGPLSPRVREQAAAVLRRLLLAESRVHRTPVAELHLHELGSPDTVLDVVGVVAGLALLEVERLYASPLVVGPGAGTGPDGRYPRPGPATLELIAMAGAPVAPSDGAADSWERTTPTGAAILTTLARFQRPAMVLHRVGYGIGAAAPAGAVNAVGLWVGSLAEEAQGDVLVLLEANIDDTPAEHLAYAQQRLMELGALDAWFTPIQMKKGRPGTMLSALVPAALEEAAASLVLRETSTLGVRTVAVGRHQARRELQQVDTPLGAVRVKVKYQHGRAVAVAPEYEDCARVARERGLPLPDVYRVAVRAAEERWLDGGRVSPAAS